MKNKQLNYTIFFLAFDKNMLIVFTFVQNIQNREPLIRRVLAASLARTGATMI